MYAHNYIELAAYKENHLIKKGLISDIWSSILTQGYLI